jgi:hypothetical protein
MKQVKYVAKDKNFYVQSYVTQGNVSSMPTSVNTACNKVSDGIDDLRGTVHDVSDRIVDMVQGIRDTLIEHKDVIVSSYTQEFYDMILQDVLAIIAIIYELLNGRVLTPSTISIIYGMFARHKVSLDCVDYFKTLFSNFTMQSDHFDQIVSFIVWLCACLALGDKAKPDVLGNLNLSKPMLIFRQLKDYGRVKTDVTSFVRDATAFAKALGESILSYITGENIVKSVDCYGVWENRISELYADQQTFTRIRLEMPLAEEILKLWQQGVQFGRGFINYCDPKMKQKHMDTIRMLLTLHGEAIKSPVFSTYRREEPYCIYIHGTPGVGKTTIINQLKYIVCEEYLLNAKAQK